MRLQKLDVVQVSNLDPAWNHEIPRVFCLDFFVKFFLVKVRDDVGVSQSEWALITAAFHQQRRPIRWLTLEGKYMYR